MKKLYTFLLIVCLLITTVFPSCENMKGPDSLTNEEIMALPREDADPYLTYYETYEPPSESSLNQIAKNDKGFNDLMAVTGQIVSTRYVKHWKYDAVDKVLTICEFRIDEVDDPDNNMGIKPGDVIQLLPYWHVYEDPNIERESVHLTYLSEYYGKKFTTIDDWKAFAQTQEILHEFAIDYIPDTRGEAFVYYRPENLIMLEGINYRGLLKSTPQPFSYRSQEYYTLVYPYDTADPNYLTTLKETYGMEIQPQVESVIKELMQTKPFSIEAYKE